MFCISQFCYCCLKKRKQLININELDIDEVSFKDKFTFCYLRTETVPDEIPKLICQKCCKGIDFMYNFRKMYLHRRKFLKGYITDLQQANEDFSNACSNLTVDVLNVDDFLLNQSLDSVNYKDESIDIKTEPEEITFDNNLLQETNDYILAANPFTLQIEDNKLIKEDLELPNQQFEDRDTSNEEATAPKEESLQSEAVASNKEENSINISVATEHNYEIVKNNEENETNPQNGDVYTANTDNNVLRIVRQKEENGLKIVIRKSNRGNKDDQLEDSDIFFCNICEKSFELESDLNLHLINHESLSEYICIFCDKKCLSIHQLEKHEMTHPKKNFYSCKICKKKIKRKMAYKIHMSKHTGNYNFRCSVCNKGFASKHNLINHKLTHCNEKSTINVNNDRVETKTTDKAAITPEKVNPPTITVKAPVTPAEDKFRNGRYKATITHNLDEFKKTLIMINKLILRRGRPKKIKAGPESPKKIIVETDKKKTRGRPRKIYNDICEICDRTFANRTGLDKHNYWFHTTNECDVCHIKFKHKGLLGMHRKKNANCRLECEQHLKTHVNDSNAEDTLTGVQNGGQFENNDILTPIKINIAKNEIMTPTETFLKCTHCNKNFLNKIQFDTHQLIHTFHCKFCPNKFVTNAQLQNHLSRKHNQTFSNCKFCPKSFKSNHNLNKHMVAFHVNESVKHPCEFCDKSFIKLSHLRRHIKSHNTIEKTYSCSECNKVFSAKSNLIKHLVIHTNDMSYQCSICDKRFNSANIMIRHMKTVHDEGDDYET